MENKRCEKTRIKELETKVEALTEVIWQLSTRLEAVEQQHCADNNRRRLQQRYGRHAELS